MAARTLQPYRQLAKSSYRNLIAARAGELRTYREARILQIIQHDRHFERRADFDLPVHWRGQLERFGALQPEYGFSLAMAAERLGFAQQIVPGR